MDRIYVFKDNENILDNQYYIYKLFLEKGLPNVKLQDKILSINSLAPLVFGATNAIFKHIYPVRYLTQNDVFLLYRAPLNDPSDGMILFNKKSKKAKLLTFKPSEFGDPIPLAINEGVQLLENKLYFFSVTHGFKRLFISFVDLANFDDFCLAIILSVLNIRSPLKNPYTATY